MKVRILLALIVAAAVAGLWWFGREDSEPDRRRELVEVPEPPAEAHAPVEFEREEPEPEEVESGGEPEDPVESGSCELLLRVVDAETRKRVRTEVTLWRLDVPADEHWTQGDQVQGKRLARDGVALFRNLPSGDYRVVCARRRVSGEDSRVIRVEGERTEETLAVLMPRKHRVYLKLFDLDGELLRKGTIEREGELRSPTDHAPGWRRSRLPLAPGNEITSPSGSRDEPTYHFSRKSWESVATGRGFDLGEFEENPRQWTRTYELRVRGPGCACVVTHIAGDLEGETTYVGLAVPEEPIRARILLPDGRRADRAGARITISTLAEKADGLEPMKQLRNTMVRVRIRHAGFERRAVGFSAFGPRRIHYLRPRPSAGGRG